MSCAILPFHVGLNLFIYKVDLNSYTKISCNLEIMQYAGVLDIFAICYF
jgi:hypothetical protein